MYESTADMQAAAAEIAVALGEGWSAVEPDLGRDVMWLQGPDRITLGLTAYRWQGQDRWEIRGEPTDDERTNAPPSGAGGAACPREITVARTKSSAQIAQEIRRRLLDAWTVYVAQARARVALRDEHRARVIAIGDRLIAHLGGRARWARPESSCRSVISFGHRDIDPVHGSLAITCRLADDAAAGPDRIEVELEMSPDDAETVLAMLAEPTP